MNNILHYILNIIPYIKYNKKSGADIIIYEIIKFIELREIYPKTV